MHLVGREIEPDLAAIANALLRRMLVCEFQLAPKSVARLTLVKVGDSLDPKFSLRDDVDHEVGNPPFLRLGGTDKRLVEVDLWRDRFRQGQSLRAVCQASSRGSADRRHDRLRDSCVFSGRPGIRIFSQAGLAARRSPSRGPHRKAERRFPRCHSRRLLRGPAAKAEALAEPPASVAASGVFRRDGKFVSKGVAQIETNGAPWRLPGIELVRSSTLKDWGYRATVGYLVANRQPKRLHKRAAKGRYPLIWAKAITPEGAFDFERGAAFKGYGWADAPADAPYVVRTACVAVQRTSSRGQKRRLNAASISKDFHQEARRRRRGKSRHLLVPNSPDAASPEALAEALNNAAASAALDRVCGSASISVRLLESIELGVRPMAGRPARTERASAVGYVEPAVAMALP